MTEGKISNDRERVRSYLLLDHVLDLAGFVALVEMAENQTSNLIEHPCQFELGQ